MTTEHSKEKDFKLCDNVGFPEENRIPRYPFCRELGLPIGRDGVTWIDGLIKHRKCPFRYSTNEHCLVTDLLHYRLTQHDLDA